MEKLLTREPIAMADSEWIMRQRFFSDCLLFDLADEGRIVACRCPAARQRTGESVFRLMSREAQLLLMAHLRAYASRPLLVETVLGVGVIVTGLVPSAALGLLLIPDLSEADLLGLFSGEEGIEAVWQEALTERYRKEEPALLDPNTEAAHALRWEVECGSPRGETLWEEPGTWRISEEIHRWSRLAGCLVLLTSEEDSFARTRFDRGLFSAFLLTVLLLCRRVSSHRGIKLSLEPRGKEMTACVQIPLRSARDVSEETAELLFLRSLADRRRIPFDYTVSDLLLCLRFTPIRPDWSYLGIKQPEDAEWWLIGEKVERKADGWDR